MDIIIMVAKIISLAIVGGFLSTFVHESGHVIAGLVNGWKFVFITVGPFKIYADEPGGKIKFGIEKNLLYWGGISATLPQDAKKENTDTFAKVLIGGPAASLIFGVLCIGIFALTKAELFIMAGFIALGQGTACAIPMKVRTGSILNDGTRYMRIRGKGRLADEEKASFLISIDLLLDPKCGINSDQLEVLLSSEDPVTRYIGCFYEYLSASNREDADACAAAKAKMDEAGKLVPPSVRKQYSAV